MSVYFIQAGPNGPIKIGWTKRNQPRLDALQTASPAPLAILKVIEGTRATEAELHMRFHGSKVRGEWFRATPDLLAYIAEAPGLNVIVANGAIRFSQLTKLQRYIERYPGGMEEFAIDAGVGRSPHVVFSWLQGRRIPGRWTLVRLAKMSRGEIQPNDFYPEIQQFINAPKAEAA